MDCLPLPSDIINKIQLYVSTPEADMIRTKVCMDSASNISLMIEIHWLKIKSIFIDGFNQSGICIKCVIKNLWNYINDLQMP